MCQGETARHVLAANSSAQQSCLVHALHAVGAARCPAHLPQCAPGCSPLGSYDGAPPEALCDARDRERNPYDLYLDDIMGGLQAAGGRYVVVVVGGELPHLIRVHGRCCTTIQIMIKSHILDILCTHLTVLLYIVFCLGVFLNLS